MADDWGQPLTKLFISYRRADSQHAVDRLYEALRKHLPKKDIFIDVDNIPKGVDFADHLSRHVSQCETLLAIVGPQWLNLADETGQRRLDSPDDFVRIEIAAALKRNIQVVPVLLDGTPMPRADQLPPDLKGFERRNAAFLSRNSFRGDIDKLIADLRLTRKRYRWYIGALASISFVVGIAGLIWSWTTSPLHFSSLETAGIEGQSVVQGGGLSESGSVEVRLPAITKPSKAKTESDRLLVAGDVFSDCPDCPSMIVVPAGSFTTGSLYTETGLDAGEGQERTVTISSDFAVGRYEVTWAEWDACVADGGCSSAWRSLSGGDEGMGKGKRPVINVSWDDAQAYIYWLSRTSGERYRLLSAAEWQYAASAGKSPDQRLKDSLSHEDGNFGSFQFEELGDGQAILGVGQAKGLASGRDLWEGTAPVGSFPANSFGLYDMYGNVEEWTQDCYNENYFDFPENGTAWTSGDCSRRGAHGGRFLSNPEQSNEVNFTSGSVRSSSVGFRVARTL